MYVGDLVSGSNTIEELEVINQKYIELFRNDRFNLHKWYSNLRSLRSSSIKSESELTYAKEKLKKADLSKSTLE